jgi:UPF0271 protein
MRVIDLNADVGEADNPIWAAAEAQILKVVSSANIACGGHAGNEQTMRTTIQLAKANNVTIGAHPAYPDKENFGRHSLVLGEDISAKALKLSLTEQISRLAEIASDEGVFISYVKPHGALYNDAVRDSEKANLIADVIEELDKNLILLGGPQSEMTRAAKAAQLDFIAEGFIDRRYTDDGHLLSRTIEGAVLDTNEARVAQTLDLAFEKSVETHTGKRLKIEAQSLCLHGDSEGAVQTAIQARQALEHKGVIIKSFANTHFNRLSYVV